jgi:hypothetical protein
MIVKFEKLFESLPRQSTVDQLKRIRKEIKKHQRMKSGPKNFIDGGDIGDKVNNDMKKHKMSNSIRTDNPIDRHIDSYESFIKHDSKKSLGYM